MISTKRRLIVCSVVLGVFLLLVEITATFFEDPPTRSSREFEQVIHEMLAKVDRERAEAHDRPSKFFEDGSVVDQNG
jgi:hypothetical protein